MATNEQINSILVLSQVPPDQDCNISSLTAILTGAVNFLSVQQNPAGEGPAPDNSIAEQALNAANTALAQIAAINGAAKARRTIAPQPIPTGDSFFTFTFPEMPSTDYDVIVTLYAGTSTHPTQFYGFRILKSSITTTGVTISFDNTPANSEAAVLIIQR